MIRKQAARKVSVIIPVYCMEQYVAIAVNSVLQQTYTNFELIIVDNGSTDRSIEICRQFKDARIKIIQQENRGPSGSRNTGIRHATGDYITFLDADDIWHPEKLARHVAHLDQSPQVGVSVCYSAFIDTDGNSLGLYMMPKLCNITPGHVLCRCPQSNGSVSVYRRELFDDIAFQDNLRGYMEDCYFDERLKSMEDVECWLRMALTKWQIGGIPEALTLYRVNDKGSSANIPQHLEHLDKVVERIRTYAPEFIAEWENPYRANQLRFLARRMVTLGDGPTAVKLMHKALATDRCLLKEDPTRTIVTLAAAYLLLLLPKLLFEQAKNFALEVAEKRQQRRMARQAST
jgi:glycosyltransferase involved in cell wall biosynthesis